ncbi:hypothetical protein HYT92_01530 [Candidatus Pacearchaeota archaeon]|nr:hypothetical protein [Candidatus Pacearchaeota archaeon]
MKRFSSGLFWGLLIFVILDELLPFVPLGSALILFGLFSTAFMRGFANLLLRYCDSVSSEEYRLSVTFEGDTKEEYYCPMFIQRKNKRELIIPQAYGEPPEKRIRRARSKRVEGTYTHLEISKVVKRKD